MEHFKLELIEYLDYYNNRRIKAKLKGLNNFYFRILSNFLGSLQCAGLLFSYLKLRDGCGKAGKTDLQKAQGYRDFRASSAPFYFQKNSTPGRRMGDRGALDRFTIELYKTAKEMSIENLKKCGYFSCF